MCEERTMITFCVKYINKTRCVCLIEAAGYEDVPERFRSEGYKGQITSVQIAK
jgi:hypothetical protein